MAVRVKIGIGLGQWRLGLPSAAALIEVARRAEDWGLDSFWLSDHVSSSSPELDVVASLSMLAAHTSTIKLGPSVLLLNLRHPVLVAKAFASLDYLSHGRMVMAVGTGNNLTDYATCGVPLQGRGQRLDEGIAIMRALWRDADVSFHGRHYNFDHLTIQPRPRPRANNDSGTLDIWVGGKSEAALKRTARLADGYFASVQSPAEFAANMASIRAFARQYGRANARIEAGIILRCRLSSSQARARQEAEPFLALMGAQGEAVRERGAFGSATEIRERIAAYEAVGLDKFVLWPMAAPEEWPAQVEAIGRHVAA
jgi:probable F420-dependent oxidoreductase